MAGRGGLSVALTVSRARAAAAAAAPLVRWLQGRAPASVRPVNVTLLRAPSPNPSFKGLELEYDDGHKFRFCAEFLRVQSPSAESMRKTSSGKRRVVSGRRHVHILGLEPVGNYGIRIRYDDTHDTGIYTWSYLHNLGRNKFLYMREYIKSLREHGLSRDPLRRN